MDAYACMHRGLCMHAWVLCMHAWRVVNACRGFVFVDGKVGKVWIWTEVRKYKFCSDKATNIF